MRRQLADPAPVAERAAAPSGVEIIPGPAGTSAARVLVVCSGNICRSPAAERLLAAGLGDRALVTSAGVQAVVGSAMTTMMARLVADAGLDAGDFVARQLTADMARESDLVLTMTREHRAAVVDLAPAAVRRTFTLRELARLADQMTAGAGATVIPAQDLADRIRELPAHASRQRGRVPSTGQDDDIRDPYGHDEAAYARAFAEIEDAARQVMAALQR